MKGIRTLSSDLTAVGGAPGSVPRVFSGATTIPSCTPGPGSASSSPASHGCTPAGDGDRCQSEIGCLMMPRSLRVDLSSRPSRDPAQQCFERSGKDRAHLGGRCNPGGVPKRWTDKILETAFPVLRRDTRSEKRAKPRRKNLRLHSPVAWHDFREKIPRPGSK